MKLRLSVMISDSSMSFAVLNLTKSE